ncbi:MAG: phosphodiester glycosidase family protein, partial [Polyangiales bacterium]
NGRTVYMVTVDGRRATSHGGSLTEMAELMVELGAFRAINLDGGGSTTMFVAAEGGVVNRPSRGWEREVINHVGVIAPAPPPAAAAVAPTVTETPPEVVQRAEQVRAQASPQRDVTAGEGTGLRGWLRARFGRFAAIDRLHLGRNREVVVPLLFVGGVMSVLSVVLYVVSRVKRARSRKAREKSLPTRPSAVEGRASTP